MAPSKPPQPTGCQIDETLERVEIDTFAFPLGVYPVEKMQPKAGYAVQFEPADGDDQEVEEWPDRYVFEAVVTATRLPQLMRSLATLLPERVFPILDIIGYDAYREIDPYISYELVGRDRFIDALRRFGPVLFEDGWCGIGAMSDAPFFYLFLDEHKVLTIRCTEEHRERVEAVLKAFDLEPVDQPAAADFAAHEHRSVVMAPEDRPDLLSFDEICDVLRDEWRLVLNIDAEQNTDESGQPLGVVGWRCHLQLRFSSQPEVLFVEVFLEAQSLNEADYLAQQAAERMLESIDRLCDDARMLQADRLVAADLAKSLRGIAATAAGEFVDHRKATGESGLLAARWLR